MEGEGGTNKKVIGAHLSTSGGLHGVQQRMEEIGAETCGLFLKNQRQFSAAALAEPAIRKFVETVRRRDILLPHGSYLINLASEKGTSRGYPCLIDDLRRCQVLGITYYNLHPGSDTESVGRRAALRRISSQINRAHGEVPGVVILIENMAGQGRVLGRTFEDLAEIISGVEDRGRIGVTLDTCHMFAAGYDIASEDKFERVMEEFESVVGSGYLKAMHLNDSKFGLGSRKDRHESIGKGQIGLEAFRYIMNSRRFDNIPMVLETPDPAQYKEEIALLRSLVETKQ